MQKKNLYFIAVIPGQDLQEQIKTLKLSMKEKFKAKHALKSPAHITLQMPFRREESFEVELIRKLKQFAKKQQEFTVKLSGFSCFTPRVIYVKVSDFTYLTEIHSTLKDLLINDLKFEEKEVMKKIHPHMTLATRDLTKPMFTKAWDYFKEKDFSESFAVNSIFLLRHNGKDWDVFREFPFSDREN